MISHENRLPADNSHEISCLICYFSISSKILNCCLLQIIGGALSQKLKMSYCDGWISIVRRQQLLKRTSPKLMAGFLPNLSEMIFMTIFNDCSNGSRFFACLGHTG